MPKEMNRFTRVIKLLNVLFNGELVISDFANDTGVSVRTIQRDIRAVEDAGFPIYSNRPGHIRFTDGFSLNKFRIKKRGVKQDKKNEAEKIRHFINWKNTGTQKNTKKKRQQNSERKLDPAAS